MKALIFDRYLDTLGGGERYSLTFASVLINLGYNVELAWNNQETLNAAQKKFGLNLEKIKLNQEAYSTLFSKSSILARKKLTKHYDLIFWVSDGSLPLLFSKKTLVHFQVPFKRLGGNSVSNTLKSLTYTKVVYNSNFTKKVIHPQIPLARWQILYPPIDTKSFSPAEKKRNVIISVARFDSPSHAKRQDVLIAAFAKLHKNIQTYKLLLVGGVKGEGGKAYLSSLKKLASGLPIEFVPNPDFKKLVSLYATAKFFWHAAGYEIDEINNPEKVEHFGITTVEAMSSGCVPIVINKGGQKEIITTDTGHLSDTTGEMVENTTRLIKSPDKLKKFSQNATTRAQEFSREHFENSIKEML